jgi:ATP-binding cassette subfamily C (CFTR/MRP) protein 4
MFVLRAFLSALGVGIYLVSQLTWIGAFSIVILFLSIPIQICIGKKIGEIVHDINVLKDQRIKLYSEIIDGIRFIKIYGWEHAFSHFVKIARNEETREYLRYYVWSSIAQGVAQTSVFWAGYLCYVGLFYSGNSHVLSSVKLLATMQSINGLKIKMSELGVGIPAYYTLSAVFERFAFILNMEPVQMKCIDKKVWEEERKSEDVAV